MRKGGKIFIVIFIVIGIYKPPGTLLAASKAALDNVQEDGQNTFCSVIIGYFKHTYALQYVYEEEA